MTEFRSTWGPRSKVVTSRRNNIKLISLLSPFCLLSVLNLFQRYWFCFSQWCGDWQKLSLSSRSGGILLHPCIIFLHSVAKTGIKLQSRNWNVNVFVSFTYVHNRLWWCLVVRASPTVLCSPLIIKYNPQVLSRSFTVVLDRWGVRDGQGETDWYSRLNPPIHSKTKWIHLKASLKIRKKTLQKVTLFTYNDFS